MRRPILGRVAVALPAIFLLAGPVHAGSCLDAMNAYYSQELFQPGKNLQRNRFLVGTRISLTDPLALSLAKARCQGQAYAWELLSQVAKSTPDSGADWTNWRWQDPAAPSESALGGAFSLFLQERGTPSEKSEDFDTFTMVHFNPIAAAHAREKMLPDNKRKLAHDLGWRSFEEFPATATSVKTIWRRIPRDGCIALGIWNGVEGRVADGDIYGDDRWKNHALVYDGRRTDAKPDCDHTESPTRKSDQMVKAQDGFIWMRVSKKTPTDRFNSFPTGAKVASGDLLILVGMHISRKDMPDWAWVTTWWKPEPLQKPEEKQGRDKMFPGSSRWNNYVLNYSLSFQYPELAGRENLVFNPYLEAGKIRNGTRSNCVACHAKAGYANQTICGSCVPAHFGDDSMLYLFEGATMTDYSWTSAAKRFHSPPPK
jgi:hypothetical protein